MIIIIILFTCSSRFISSFNFFLVPNEAPQHIKAYAISSKAIKVTWKVSIYLSIELVSLLLFLFTQKIMPFLAHKSYAYYYII